VACLAGQGFGRWSNGPEFFVGLEQHQDSVTQFLRPGAALADEGVARCGRELQRGQKDFAQSVGVRGHGGPPYRASPSNAEMSGRKSGKMAVKCPARRKDS